MQSRVLVLIWCVPAIEMRVHLLSLTLLPQTYYKLPYVDQAITNPEQRICEGGSVLLCHPDVFCLLMLEANE